MSCFDLASTRQTRKWVFIFSSPQLFCFACFNKELNKLFDFRFLDLLILFTNKCLLVPREVCNRRIMFWVLHNFITKSPCMAFKLFCLAFRVDRDIDQFSMVSRPLKFQMALSTKHWCWQDEFLKYCFLGISLHWQHTINLICLPVVIYKCELTLSKPCICIYVSDPAN